MDSDTPSLGYDDVRSFPSSHRTTFTGGAIVHLRIGRGSSFVASYVAMTRIEKRQDMLICSAFERGCFTKAPRRGPELLLQVLRVERFDKQAIEDDSTPKGRCAGCGVVKFKQDFALQQ